MHCCKPPLIEVPEGDFYCRKCEEVRRHPDERSAQRAAFTPYNTQQCGRLHAASNLAPDRVLCSRRMTACACCGRDRESLLLCAPCGLPFTSFVQLLLVSHAARHRLPRTQIPRRHGTHCWLQDPSRRSRGAESVESEGSEVPGKSEDAAEDEEDDLELAWRELEVARGIYTSAGRSHFRELARVYVALAELSLVREDYVNCVPDFQTAIDILQSEVRRGFGPTPRALLSHGESVQ